MSENIFFEQLNSESTPSSRKGEEGNLLLIILVSFLVGPNSNEDFVVEISGTTVTITCPLSGDNIKWEPTGKKVIDNKYVIEDHDSSPLSVTCMENEDNKNKRVLYLNARVCANCEELDTLAVIGIIIADLLITLGVLILVHYCSKNKRGQTSAGAGRRPQEWELTTLASCRSDVDTFPLVPIKLIQIFQQTEIPYPVLIVPVK
ncbi:UNVERIFIED_CONTAM: hypothetical protein H355_012907 [Colinus virginianus]|nr:hypothetical protein H355_012907 [Colinus virginianus]